MERLLLFIFGEKKKKKRRKEKSGWRRKWYNNGIIINLLGAERELLPTWHHAHASYHISMYLPFPLPWHVVWSCLFFHLLWRGRITSAQAVTAAAALMFWLFLFPNNVLFSFYVSWFRLIWEWIPVSQILYIFSSIHPPSILTRQLCLPAFPEEKWMARQL